MKNRTKNKSKQLGKKRRLSDGLPPGTLVYTGDREYLPTQIYSVRFNEKDYADKKTVDDFPAYTPVADNSITWIDVRSLHDAPLIERLGLAYHVHPLALEDVLDTQQRAKMEEYDNHMFFILHHLKLNSELMELKTEQIAVYTGDTFVLSFQEDPDDTYSAIRKRILENLGRVRKRGVDYLMYSLLDVIVDGYFVVLDELDHQIIELEQNIYLRGAEMGNKARLFEIKQIVSQFKSKVMPLRDAIFRLYRCESIHIEDSTRPYFRDVSDHVTQALEIADNQRELLSNLEALFQAEASNRLNEVMRLLTVINTIFIPLTFIAGVYGMNFDNMPELRMHYAYFAVMGFMGSLAIGMLVYFRWKKWI
ncbi:MAG: magnesium/cobalt transporter CorA [Saprospiraceae bacterium]